MQIRITVAAALLLTCATAFAQFKTTQLAHEVPLSEFVVPVTQNGILNFRLCADCESISSTLTSETRYIINRQDVELSEFRNRLAVVRERSTRILTVLQKLDTNTVTLVSIQL
jgi:hypothetical protein